MPQRQPGVTLEHVARHAGVSRATVSRVVNGLATVDPAIARTVNAALRELGYVPNLSARSLASRRAGAIALVVPEDVERFFGDPFFAALVAGIHSQVDGSGFILDVLIATSTPDLATLLRGGKGDAAILFSHSTRPDLVAGISASMPVVLAGRPTDAEDADVPYVDVDNRGGAEAVTRHLLERGHRRIAMITGPSDSPAALDRLQGFHDAHEAAGIEPGPIAEGDFTARGGARATDELLAQRPWTALFAANDLMALAAMDVLRRHGQRIPDDVAVAGFDDVPAAALADPPLTTATQPSRRQGEVLAQTALALLAGKTPDLPRILPTELRVRASS